MNKVPPDDNGWWHWRGKTDSRMEDAEESLKLMWDFKEATERRINAIDIRLVIIATLAAGVGSMVSNAVAAIFK